MELMHFATVITLYLSLFIVLSFARPQSDAVTNVAPSSLANYATEPLTIQDMALNRKRREQNEEVDENVKPEDSSEQSGETSEEISADIGDHIDADNQESEQISYEDSDQSHN